MYKSRYVLYTYVYKQYTITNHSILYGIQSAKKILQQQKCEIQIVILFAFLYLLLYNFLHSFRLFNHSNYQVNNFALQMYGKLVILSSFLLPPKKNQERIKEVAKPVFNKFLLPQNYSPQIILYFGCTNKILPAAPSALYFIV